MTPAPGQVLAEERAQFLLSPVYIRIQVMHTCTVVDVDEVMVTVNS